MKEDSPGSHAQSQLTVATGTHVAVELLDAAGRSERLEFDIVPDAAADLARGFLGEGTPLARAIQGKPAGSDLPYEQADIVRVRIVSVAPARSAPDAEAAQQQDAVVRKAVEEAERTDAILFASSFSGKWGDYDPEGMDHWKKPDK
jgi:hypothetical protein